MKEFDNKRIFLPGFQMGTLYPYSVLLMYLKCQSIIKSLKNWMLFKVFAKQLWNVTLLCAVVFQLEFPSFRLEVRQRLSMFPSTGGDDGLTRGLFRNHHIIVFQFLNFWWFAWWRLSKLSVNIMVLITYGNYSSLTRSWGLILIAVGWYIYSWLNIITQLIEFNLAHNYKLIAKKEYN